MREQIGIALGFKMMTFRQQIISQFFIVIEFAVADSNHSVIFAAYRLGICRQVHDREPAETKPYVIQMHMPSGIRTAMAQLFCHGFERAQISALLPTNIKVSGDPTHGWFLAVCPVNTLKNLICLAMSFAGFWP